MEASLLGLFGLRAPSAKPDRPVLTAAKARKHEARPTAHPMRAPAQHELPRRQPQPRIAHWDKKREKCLNCSHIYLKTQSRHPGFCSVDCKSNAAYLAKVNRTIRAVKDAVDRQQQQQPEQQPERQSEQQPEQQPEQQSAAAEDEGATAETEPQPHSFADFGVESRIRDAPAVQWAFSAVY